MDALKSADNPSGFGWSAAIELQRFAFVLVVDQELVATSVQHAASSLEGNPMLYDALRTHDPSSVLAFTDSRLDVEAQRVASFVAPSKLE
jgi:hypothetical protein